MKLPRDLAAADLEKALRRALGYQCTRQSGSHRRLTTQTGGEHHLSIPAHDPLKLGTLRAIWRSRGTSQPDHRRSAATT